MLVQQVDLVLDAAPHHGRPPLCPDVFAEMAVDRPAGNSERLGDLLHRVCLLVIHCPRLPDLRCTHLDPASTFSATGAGCSQAVLRAFDDEVVFELRDRREHVEEQPSPRGCRIDSLGEGFQPDAPLLEPVDDFLQIPYRPAKPVGLRYDQGVTGAQVVQRIVEGWPLRQDTGGVLDEDLFAPGSFECGLDLFMAAFCEGFIAAPGVDESRFPFVTSVISPRYRDCSNSRTDISHNLSAAAVSSACGKTPCTPPSIAATTIAGWQSS